ncbi:uncharacterized protein LOC130776092 [Actinidia eriantha]|uniref:uncharacterized protein LOC130776092 n=1 Tax=Actinidia eriantha TaxID=165200 RepID=UPI0025845C54|nr:uncharacterized protein LOC130776092 [Actinidia eriantha]
MRITELQSPAPALKALAIRSLYKLTEVFLWDDDDSAETRERQSFREFMDCLHDDGTRSDTVFTMTESSMLLEDMELVRRMSALGLPLSFQTNKERRNGTSKGKRKDTNKKHLHSGVRDLIQANEGKVVSPTAFHDKRSNSLLLGQNESSYAGMAVDIIKTQRISGEEEELADLTARITCTAVEEQLCEGLSGIISNYSLDCGSEYNSVLLKDNKKTAASPNTSDAGTSLGSIVIVDDIDRHKKENDSGSMEFASMEDSLKVCDDSDVKSYSDICIQQPQGTDVVACSQSSEVLDHGETDSKYSGDFGDWTSYWDSFYMRNYFYNSKTHESTWDPPPGMEHLVVAEMNFNSTVSFHPSTPLDYCSLQCDTDILEPKNSDKLLDQPPSEPSEGFELAGDNFLDLMTIPTLKCASERLNVTQGIDGNCSDENSSHFLSEQSNKDFQLTDTYRAEELDCYGQISDPEKILSSEDIQSKYRGADAIQPSDASSFSSALTRALPEDSWNGDMLLETMDPATDKLETGHNYVAKELKKKANKRTRLNKNLSHEAKELQFQGIYEDLSPSISKYWRQRYRLFSRYDDGIRMDEESWFSVTPELIARHHALRCGSGIIVDCFTGVGGNAIQFAQRSKHVIAIDIDPKKIDYARHNAAIYGVDDCIEFIRGDSFLLAPRLKADSVFLSPPWGGPDYAKVTTYDIKTMLKPHDGHVLFNVARRIASKVVMFLPKNVDLNQLAELSLSVDPPWSLEVEKNYLNGKLKAITAYYTDTSV